MKTRFQHKKMDWEHVWIRKEITAKSRLEDREDIASTMPHIQTAHNWACNDRAASFATIAFPHFCATKFNF